MMNQLDLKIKKLALLAGAVLFIFSVMLYSALSLPREFGKNRLVSIEGGMGLSEIADSLKEEGVIKSSFLFKSLVFLSGDHKNIKAGEYFFDEPLSVIGVSRRLSDGLYGLSPTRVRITEGWTAWQMGARFEELGFFARSEWMKFAVEKEGYLFPDTYFFLQNTSPEKVAEAMLENFDKKIDDLMPNIEKSGRGLEDTIIMASIIEKEMASYDDGRVISGILWKRLDAGMGLQVDAALAYVTGKSSAELTQSDLTMDSPYNTYKYRGLPPTPIGNPGLDAIQAAIYPQETLYWFYLHSQGGEPYYAVDFDGHVENKRKYLR